MSTTTRETSNAVVGALAAAICLNNTGIALLEQSCFKQAVSTFHDALELLKLGSYPLASASEAGKIHSLSPAAGVTATVAAKLREARYRMANPQPTPPANQDDMISFQIVSDSQHVDMASSCGAVIHGTTSSRVLSLHTPGVDKPVPGKSTRLCLVHICPARQEEERSLETSSIILYNCAMAYTCCSATQPPSSSRLISTKVQMFRAGAYRMLVLAHTTLRSSSRSQELRCRWFMLLLVRQMAVLQNGRCADPVQKAVSGCRAA